MIRVEVPVQNDLCGEITPGGTSDSDNRANDTNTERNDTLVNDGGATRRRKRAAGTAPVPQSVLVTVMERDDVRAAIRTVSSFSGHAYSSCFFSYFVKEDSSN